MTDELQSLTPDPDANVYFVKSKNNERVEIPEITVRKFKPIFTALGPLAGHFKGKKGAEEMNLAALVAEHEEDVVKLLGVVVDRDADWVYSLKADEMFDLFGKALEVNLDFFIQKVLPSLSGAMVKISVATAGLQGLSGLRPYKPSSPPDTDSQTSSTTATASS